MPSLATRMACATLKSARPSPSGKRLGADDRTIVVAAGRLAERAPRPLECAGVGVEDDDAVIAVAVGHEQLVAARQHPRIRGAMQVRGVGVTLALVALADLHDELAVERELQQCVVGHRLQARDARGRAVVAADPGEALVVDVDAVLAFAASRSRRPRRPRT